MESLLHYIIGFGYLGIFLVVFAESGFLFGFFFPGDSLLFTVGLLASQSHFNIWLLVPLIVLAAILGDSFGYYCGRTFGPKIFSRDESILFRKAHIERTRRFYEKYGKKTIILARFVPIIRTFAPIFAGIAGMNYSLFLSFNIVGGILWGAGVTLGGYFLGNIFPQTEQYLSSIIIGIVFVSLLPMIFEFVREYRHRTA